MQFDFVIGLSLAVIVAIFVGMVYGGFYAVKHIREDSKKYK